MTNTNKILKTRYFRYFVRLMNCVFEDNRLNKLQPPCICYLNRSVFISKYTQFGVNRTSSLQYYIEYKV